MQSDLVRIIRTTIEVPRGDLHELEIPQGVPVYATTTRLLKEAYGYLIGNNPVDQKGSRFERYIQLAGPRAGDVRKLEVILYPLLKEQSAVGVNVDTSDNFKLMLELDRDGLALYGSMHNHPGHGISVTNPSIIDIGNHELHEKGYNPFLTSIISQDGYIGFWQPRAFEVFVDGKRVGSGQEPIIIGPPSSASSTQPIRIGPQPVLREFLRVYKLN